MPKNKKQKTKAIVRINRSYAIDKPAQLIQMARIVKDYILKNRLAVTIANKDYVLVEGWQFAGSLMSLFPKVIKVEKIEDNKWLAQVDLVNRKTREVISTGFALCSKAEQKKATFDEYAILSMAQTRAIGKAYRNVIGWIIKLAGYEPTPAEEMKVKPGQIVIPVEKTKLGQTNKYIEQLKKALYKMGAKTEQEAFQLFTKKTGIKMDTFQMNEKKASILLTALLKEQVK